LLDDSGRFPTVDVVGIGMPDPFPIDAFFSSSAFF
jgi:hypothetical protein